MAQSVAHKSQPENDLERLTDDAVASFGGDLRATVKALVEDNISLRQELDFASLAMSSGFSRGWFAKRREARASGAQDGDGCQRD